MRFSIDLDGLALPDAIAAVVEAWYEAQSVDNDVSNPKIDFNDYDYEDSAWERLLREHVFRGCDHEWSLGPRPAKNKTYDLQACLTHVNKRGKTEWVLLPFEWCVKNANEISDFAFGIVSWVEDESKTFAKGYKSLKVWHDAYTRRKNAI